MVTGGTFICPIPLGAGVLSRTVFTPIYGLRGTRVVKIALAPILLMS